MDGTILLQGTFTSAGVVENVAIPSGTDWMKVYNYTKIAADAVDTGYEFYYQYGMAAGTGLEYQSNGAGTAIDLVTMATGGFTVYNPSLNPNGALNNGSTGVTAISAATPPVVTVGSTAGMAAGDVVRIVDVAGAQQFGGMDFTVGYGTFAATTFSLDYAPTIVAGTTGDFYVIKYDPLFYPYRRYVTAITQAAQAVVTLSVTHNYTVGQKVRLNVPAAFGMIEMNNILADIVAVNIATGNGNNTITLNVDSSAFTAFAFPLTAAVPFTPAQVVPVGESANSAIANPNLLDDATLNSAYVGMSLGAGADGPAGQANDVIYWVAGKSSFGGI